MDIASIIEELDQRPPQVLIKAFAVEIADIDTFDFGVELASIGEPGDNPRGFGGTVMGMSTLVDSDGDGIVDSKVPVETEGVTMGVFNDTVGEIPILLQALKKNNTINVRTAPEIVVNNNSPATLSVVNQQPTTSSTIGAGGQQITSFSGFEDAGISLDISPHITEANTLRMEVTMAFEQFQGDPIDPNVPPAKVSRELTTNVTIPNGRTLVVGGLQTENKSLTVTGIPFISDIPFLGEAFKRTSEVTTTNNLYVFITPYILYDYAFGDFEHLTDVRKQYLEHMGGDLEDVIRTSHDIPALPYRFAYEPPFPVTDDEEDVEEEADEDKPAPRRP
jgi:general secretion pathway protein D